MIHTKKKLVNEIIKQVSGRSQYQDKQALRLITVASFPDQDRDGQENIAQQYHLVYRLKENVHPCIKIGLFWLVVEQCKLLRVQVALVLLQISIAIAAVIIAILVLDAIQEIGQFSSANITLTTLLASYVVPQIVMKIKSRSTRQQEKEILCGRMYVAILEYRRREIGEAPGEAVNDDSDDGSSEPNDGTPLVI